MSDHVELVSVENAGQFQVHFILKDGSHSMDAVVLHQCEGELLALLKEVGKQLDVDFRVEATAYAEGGFSVYLSFIGKHASALGLIAAAIGAICSAGVYLTFQAPLLRQQILQNDFALNRDRKLSEQQVELNELAIKKARFELRKMEQEASPDGPRAPATAATKSLPLEPPPTAGDVVPALLSQARVIKLRSQFYGHLLTDDKVSAVGFAPNHERSPLDEMVVPRANFSTYVVSPQELEPTLVRDAEIEIVSPVFRRDAFKWKGLFEKKPISFDLDDESFLSKVDAKKVKFQSGTTLICDLEIHYRETATGMPEPHGYVVKHVSKYSNQKGLRIPRIELGLTHEYIKAMRQIGPIAMVAAPVAQQLMLPRLEDE